MIAREASDKSSCLKKKTIQLWVYSNGESTLFVGMQHFLKAAFNDAYKGPCTKTVRSNLEKMYFMYRHDLREVMSKINFVSLTADIWSHARRQSFISVIAHVTTNSFDNISMLIGFRRLRSSHTGEWIKKYIKYELARSGIEFHRVTSITTDNAANFKTALSDLDFGYHFKCLSHNMNLVTSKGVCLWKAPDPNK